MIFCSPWYRPCSVAKQFVGNFLSNGNGNGNLMVMVNGNGKW